jgi:uncharacterized repeat protein (TIGR01451 family)
VTTFLRTVLNRWALLLAGLLLAVAPVAPAWACSTGGCVMAGPRLASVSSARSVLLNALLGQLTGSTINVTAADWNNVAVGDVSLLKLSNALQAQLGVSSPTQALGTAITLAQLATAAATAATGDNNSTLAGSLSSIATGLSAPSSTIKLGDLISTSTGITDTRINVLELISGAVQLYNGKNVFTTPTPITLLGSDLGLGSLIGTVQLSAQVVEPPVYVCGPVGSSFHTATLRIKLYVNLLGVNLNVSTLTALGVSASVQLTKLSLYMEVARADGTISLVNAVSNALQVQVAPGIASLYLGTMDDTLFFNRTRPVSAADLSPATVAAATINAFTLAIQAQGSVVGPSPSTSQLSFSGAYPQTLTAYTTAGFTSTLLGNLANNLTFTITPSMGTLLDNLVLPTLRALLRSGISSTLATLVSGLVDPLLELLGLRLGEVDVTAGGTYKVCALSGSVYNDANHNATCDGAEAGTGLSLYAKLVPSATPSGPAIAVAPIDPSTGAYSFSGIAVGAYTLVVGSSNSFSAITPSTPAGWVGTEQSTLSRSLTLATLDLSAQRFGLYRGSKLSGSVFADTGSGGGTANNGTRDGSEAGLAGITLNLTDSTGATLLGSSLSAGDGSFTLWLPYTVTGSVKLTPAASAAWVAVAGNAGSTSGTYALGSDSTSFTAAAGSSHTGLSFARVPANRFDSDGQQLAQAGRTVWYSHSYTAGTAGALSFLTSTTPAASNWTALLYLDANCNGQLDSGEAPITAAINVVAAQKVCVVAKVAVPAEASQGAQFALAITARLTYANSSIVGDQLRQDLTSVGDGGDALRLVKAVDRTSAGIGSVITYTITYRNVGPAALNTLKIIDQTPAFTVLSSVACGTAAAGLSCSVSTQPAVGSAGRVEWTFTGSLASGAEGTVTLAVLLQ